MAEISNTLGDIHRVGRRLDEAAREYERYHAIATEVADATNTPADRRDVAMALLGLSDLAVARNENDRAEDYAKDAIRILESLPDDAEYPQELRRDRSVAYTRLGDRHKANKDHSGAENWYRKSLVIDESRLAAAPDSATTRRDVTVDLLRVGETLIPQGQLAEALPLMERAIAMREQAVRDDPTNAQALRDLATAHYTLAQLFDARANAPSASAEHRLHSFERALAALQRAYELWDTMRERGVLRSSDLDSGQELRTNITLIEQEIAALQAAAGKREAPQSQPDPK
jgi:tetratricopeptide (TPR) repeat protein